MWWRIPSQGAELHQKHQQTRFQLKLPVSSLVHAVLTRDCRGDRAIDRELAGNAGLIIQQSLVLYPIAYLAPAKRRRQSTSVVRKQIVGTSSANITEVEGILCLDIAPASNGVTPTTTRTPCRSECQVSGRLEETTILQVLSVKVL